MQSNVAMFTAEQRMRTVRDYLSKQRKGLAALYRGNPKGKAVAEAEVDRVEAYVESLLNEHRPGAPSEAERTREIERLLDSEVEGADWMDDLDNPCEINAILTDPRELAEKIVAADPLTKWAKT